MTQHTPAPWKVKPVKGETPEIVSNDGYSMTKTICKIKDVFGYPQAYKANARLIALSPRLLYIVEKLASDDATNHASDLDHFKFYAWLKVEARAALAELEGD
jgi:hypothetical protein